MLLLACAGRAEGEPPLSGETLGGAMPSGGRASTGGINAGGTDTSSGGMGATDLSCPGEPGTEPMPVLACSQTVEVCSSDGVVSGSCNFSALSATMMDVAMGCGVYCGFMSLGMRSGCVVGINQLQLGTLAPQTPSGAEDCMKLRLLGTRWNCAPEDGWVSVYLGSCTVI